MLKFLKDIFRKEDARQPVVLKFDEIPALLEEKHQAAASGLHASTGNEQAVIRDASGRLKDLIRILLAARFDEEIHPKLKSIAQKSLPQFTKSVGMALDKDLPDDPEEFYSAAAELLKTCINSTRAQGKYLRTVFPDEMKAIAGCVADIGRSINAMNEPIGTFRALKTQINEALRIHAALADIDQDLTKSSEKEGRISRRIQEINDRIAGCERAIEEADSERRGKELADSEQELANLKKQRDQTVRRYSALSMTAAHVLRKAEKVARRKQKLSEAKAIEQAIAILSDHTVPDSGDLVAVLSAAFAPVARMIGAGEIALKNKEERSLFSTVEGFSLEIQSLCQVYARQADQCGKAEREFSSHPVIARHAELTRETKNLFDTLVKEKQTCSELVQWHESLASNIPVLREQLKKLVGMISGSDVQIHFPEINSGLS